MTDKTQGTIHGGETPSNGSTPLSSVKAGLTVRLVTLDCSKPMCERLESMGLRPGVRLEMVKASKWGPAVIGVGNARYALGRSVMHRIMVAPLETE